MLSPSHLSKEHNEAGVKEIEEIEDMDDIFSKMER